MKPVEKLYPLAVILNDSLFVNCFFALLIYQLQKMSSSILEQIRFYHELAEVYEKKIGDVLDEAAQGVSGINHLSISLLDD